MNSKVLLVEDSPEYQVLVRAALGNEFEVEAVETAAQALSCLKNQRFDLAVVDLRLPDRDGLSLCQDIRAQAGFATLPVVILTGRRELEDKLQSFRMGADDYMVKPFDPVEFRTRVLSKVQRFHDLKAAGNELRIGDVILSFSELKALHHPTAGDSANLELTPAEFRLLSVLARNWGTVLTRSQLLEVLGRSHDEIRDRTVDRHLSSLRRKLDATEVQLETVYSEGYYLKLRVTPPSLQ